MRQIKVGDLLTGKREGTMLYCITNENAIIRVERIINRRKIMVKLIDTKEERRKESIGKTFTVFKEHFILHSPIRYKKENL